MNTMPSGHLSRSRCLPCAAGPGGRRAAGAAQGARDVREGRASATIKGRLKGDGDVDYLVRAAAGQTLEVKLDASNGQNNFNVLPPDSANVAMYSST